MFSRWGLLLIVASIVLVADQASKAFVTSTLGLYQAWAPVPALADYFTITYTVNTGAAFGILPGGGVLFLVIALVVVGFILFYHGRIPDGEWLPRLALGLQLGGALGNLTDRVRLGYVVDFIDFKIWPVFNLADSAIVVGVALLIWIMWREDRREKLSEPAGREPPRS